MNVTFATPINPFHEPVFYEGRTPPKVIIDSPQNIDFYEEQVVRAFEGHEVRRRGDDVGTRLTGDHSYYLNFCPIPLNLPDPKRPGKLIERIDYPLYSQDDDYFYKQVEEAEQDNKGVMLMTARGWGKTFVIVAVGQKIYQLIPNSHGIISGSLDDHANETFLKFKRVLDECEKRHPTLRKKRLENNESQVLAGEIKIIDGERIGTLGSIMEKIIYANNPGKTRGRRINFQHFEEVGDWAGAATLKKCHAASEGTWKVGAAYKARVFYTGTGGTVKSRQAEEMYYNPGAFNLYMVKDRPDGKKTAIFYDCTQKCGSFWEKEGPVIVNGQAFGNVAFAGSSDRVGARAYHEAERAKRENDQEALEKYSQEYPFNEEEMFRQSGKAVFNRAQLARHLSDIRRGKYKPGEYGTMEWAHNEAGVRTHVTWHPLPYGRDGKQIVPEDTNGLMFIPYGGHPEKDEAGVPKKVFRQYIGALDSIDQANEDSIVDDGSKLGMLVKRRQGRSSAGVAGQICCEYLHRPEDINEAFDNVLKICWYYNCQFNLEYTKIYIRGFLVRHGEMWRIIDRPKIALVSEEAQNAVAQGKQLLGTQMTPRLNVYGLNLIKEFLREDLPLCCCPRTIEQLLGYNKDEKTKFDLVAAFQHLEIADEDLLDTIPREVNTKPVRKKKLGYYNDPVTGYKVWGPIPGSDQEPTELGRPTGTPPISYYNAKNEAVFVEPLQEPTESRY